MASGVPPHLPTGSLHVESPASMRSSIQTTLVWGLLDSPCMGNQPCPQTSNSQPGVMTSYPKTPPWGPGGERVLQPLPPNHLCRQRSFHPLQPTEVPAPGCKRQGECPLKCVCACVYVQTCGRCCLFLLDGFWESNSGCKARREVPFFTCSVILPAYKLFNHYYLRLLRL